MYIQFALALNFNSDNFTSRSTEDQHHKIMQSKIDGTKKSASKEMEQNEKLEAFKLRLSTDIETLEANRNFVFSPIPITIF